MGSMDEYRFNVKFQGPAIPINDIRPARRSYTPPHVRNRRPESPPHPPAPTSAFHLRSTSSSRTKRLSYYSPETAATIRAASAPSSTSQKVLSFEDLYSENSVLANVMTGGVLGSRGQPLKVSAKKAMDENLDARYSNDSPASNLTDQELLTGFASNFFVFDQQSVRSTGQRCVPSGLSYHHRHFSHGCLLISPYTHAWVYTLSTCKLLVAH